MREMKDSGIKSFGLIPYNWNITKLKNILSLRSEKNSGNRELLSVYLNRGVISYADSTGMQVHKPSQDLSNYQNIYTGDFVLNNQQAWRGSVGVSKYSGIISPAYFVYRISSDCYPQFMNFLLRDSSMVQQYENSSRGVGTIQRNIFAPWLLECLIALPDYSEQIVIAEYLEMKCNEIEILISDIQQQIETLEEYKRSVITEAVTKGLDPDVEMRDSGVQWMGKIPKHWGVDNPKWHFVQRKDRATKGLTQLTASQKYGVVTQEEYMEITGAKVVTVEKDFDILKLVCPGDFIIHMRSFQGGLEYSEKYGSISSAYVMLIPQKTILEPRFYKWFFKSPVYIDALSSTSNLIRDGQAMRYANFIQLPIPLMPLKEQQQIADYLDKKCAEIDCIISEKKQQIETIEEYKKSLIFEYVTGKKEIPSVSIIIDHKMLLAYIMYILEGEIKGKVHLQKIKYLCELVLGINLENQYYRFKRGPYDKKLDDYLKEINRLKWYNIQIYSSPMTYTAGENFTSFYNQYSDCLSKYEAKIKKFVDCFVNLTPKQTERLATLYASWNDMIIDGHKNPTFEELHNDIITNWTPNKNNFKKQTWKDTYDIMLKLGIVPKGNGLHTIH